MQTSTDRQSRRSETSEKELIHRGGLLRFSKQLEESPSGKQDEFRSKFVIAFCKYLIKNTWNYDLLYLAAYAAKDATGGTPEEARDFIEMIRAWKKG